MAREYYSIPEAAAMLGLSRIAVFKRVKKGQLEALRFGRNWAVPASALGAAAATPPLPPQPVPPAPALKPQAGPARGKTGSKATPPPPADAEMDSMGWD